MYELEDSCTRIKLYGRSVYFWSAATHGHLSGAVIQKMAALSSFLEWGKIYLLCFEGSTAECQDIHIMHFGVAKTWWWTKAGLCMLLGSKMRGDWFRDRLHESIPARAASWQKRREGCPNPIEIVAKGSLLVGILKIWLYISFVKDLWCMLRCSMAARRVPTYLCMATWAGSMHLYAQVLTPGGQETSWPPISRHPEILVPEEASTDAGDSPTVVALGRSWRDWKVSGVMGWLRRCLCWKVWARYGVWEAVLRYRIAMGIDSWFYLAVRDTTWPCWGCCITETDFLQYISFEICIR